MLYPSSPSPSAAFPPDAHDKGIASSVMLKHGFLPETGPAIGAPDVDLFKCQDSKILGSKNRASNLSACKGKVCIFFTRTVFILCLWDGGDGPNLGAKMYRGIASTCLVLSENLHGRAWWGRLTGYLYLRNILHSSILPSHSVEGVRRSGSQPGKVQL